MPPYVAALRETYERGAVQVVTLELLADGEAWREMLDSGEWRRLPLLRSVLPVVDGALLRPTWFQRRQEDLAVVPAYEVDVSPEHWSLVERAAVIEQLALILAGRDPSWPGNPGVEGARYMARELLAMLSPWDGARLLQSSSSWCEFFMDVGLDYSVMVLGPEGAVTMFCATDDA